MRQTVNAEMTVVADLFADGDTTWTQQGWEAWYVNTIQIKGQPNPCEYSEQKKRKQAFHLKNTSYLLLKKYIILK